MRILVLAAHPDDEVLGCGGTLARYAAAGEHIEIAIFGEGATSRFPDRDLAPTSLVDALCRDANRASELLGARRVHMLGLPDNRFDTVPMLEVVKHVEALIQLVNPHAVFVHHGGDLNIDHAVLFRATLTATRPQAGQPVRTVYAYEVASSTEWAFQQFSPSFRPNVFVDITATLATKIEAMAVYESEVRAFPHPRSAEALQATARRWGSVAGLSAAEPFQLIRDVR